MRDLSGMSISSNYLVAVNLVLLTLAAYSASSITNTLIAARLTPPPRVELSAAPPPAPVEGVKSATYYRSIAGRDIFNPVPQKVSEPAPLPKDLTVKLLGVAVHDDAQSSYCVIEDQKLHKQGVYRTGALLEGTDATVQSIEWDRVVLLRGGRQEVVEMQAPQSGSAAPGGPSSRTGALSSAGSSSGSGSTAASAPGSSGSRTASGEERIRLLGENQYQIDRAEVDDTFDNLSQVFTQVRAVPHFEGGKATGFRLFQIRQGSLFEKIGLKNGDVIQKINGQELSDPSRAMGMLQELRGESELTIELVRNRQPQTLSYQVR